MGKGNNPNKAQPLTDNEVDKLYTTGQMEVHNPDALLRMLWFQNTVHFGMRTVTEHINNKMGRRSAVQNQHRNRIPSVF